VYKIPNSFKAFRRSFSLSGIAAFGMMTLEIN
jgi:hypothetical protein